MKNNKVAIVGVGRSMMEAPFFDKSWEIWGLNHHYNKYPRWDLWFNLHKKEYIDYKHITQANYPYSDVLKMRNIEIFNYKHIIKYKYFASTMSYMTAYAILKGYKHILYAGCDFVSENEKRTYQRECLEQWIAFAQGKGIKISVVSSTPLCKETGLYSKD